MDQGSAPQGISVGEEAAEGPGRTKDEHRIHVPVDVDLDEAIRLGARHYRLKKGPWLRLLAIQRLIDMGLWPPKKKGQTPTR